MKIRIERTADSIFRARERKKMLIFGPRKIDVANMYRVEPELPQDRSRASREALVQDKLDHCRLTETSRYLDHVNPVIQVRRRESQRLLQIFFLKFRIFAKEFVPIWISCEGKEYASNCQPHASNAWLSIHLSRVDGDPIKGWIQCHEVIVRVTSKRKGNFS
jgi:hypothetical protein